LMNMRCWRTRWNISSVFSNILVTQRVNVYYV
jgi:hypothetical protein